MIYNNEVRFSFQYVNDFLIFSVLYWLDGQNSKKRKVRGTLKGLTATTKRAKHGNQKLKVGFSRVGGAIGDNRRTFTDEIVLFTRRKAPLIGVRTWKNIHQDVKDSLVTDMMVSSIGLSFVHKFSLSNY